MAVVVHTAESALSIIDGTSLRVRDVVRGFAEPRYVATDLLDPVFAYVTVSQGTLCVADRSGRVLGRLRVARSSHGACFVVSA